MVSFSSRKSDEIISDVVKMKPNSFFVRILSLHENLLIFAKCKKILIIITGVSDSPTSRDSKSLLES